MKPIRLEIVTKVVTFFDHCRRCQVLFDQAGLNKKIHQKGMEEYPPGFKRRVYETLGMDPRIKPAL